MRSPDQTPLSLHEALKLINIFTGLGGTGVTTITSEMRDVAHQAINKIAINRVHALGDNLSMDAEPDEALLNETELAEVRASGQAVLALVNTLLETVTAEVAALNANIATNGSDSQII